MVQHILYVRNLFNLITSNGIYLHTTVAVHKVSKTSGTYIKLLNILILNGSVITPQSRI